MNSSSGAWKWRSSERIAFSMLEDMGYRVLETHKRVRIEGVDIAEVDAIAVDENGECYAVEVKAGRVDVNAIRQAFANAALTGCKPLVVGRGFADKAAEETAKKLGVRVVLLPDYIVVDVDELERACEEAGWRLLEAILESLEHLERLKPSDVDLLKALAESETIQDYAEKLGTDVRGAASRLAEARRRGVLPKSIRSFHSMRVYAKLALSLLKLRGLVDTLSSSVEKLAKLVEEL